MNSKQEKIVHDICQKSLGAPFIFEPDEYIKGNSTREPADLVWTANNCIILFYMKGKKHKAGVQGDVIKHRKEKLISDNINQAKGWLKYWREGNFLIGKNDFQEFKIPFDEFKYVIVLGIIDYGIEDGYYHLDHEEFLGVKYCATISEKDFESLSKIDITAVDIIELVCQLKLDKNSTFSSLMDTYYQESINYAYNYVKQLMPEIDPAKDILNIMSFYLNLLRSSITISKKNYNHEAALMFNDVFIHQYYKLIILLGSRISFQEKNQKIILIESVDLGIYKIFIGISHHVNFSELSPKIFGLSKDEQTKFPKRNVSVFTYESSLGAPIFAINKRMGKSQAEIFLENN